MPDIFEFEKVTKQQLNALIVFVQANFKGVANQNPSLFSFSNIS